MKNRPDYSGYSIEEFIDVLGTIDVESYTLRAQASLTVLQRKTSLSFQELIEMFNSGMSPSIENILLLITGLPISTTSKFVDNIRLSLPSINLKGSTA